ncbi:MAG TPA: hypothetical protein PK926_15490 [Spirochaetota bacterium]|nr:hypothetical protein [Spirochaetota bacterium]HPR48358.1 hypothetical protein [Spirochaetota bacterium]
MSLKKFSLFAFVLFFSLVIACDDDGDNDKDGGSSIPADGLIHYYTLDGHANDTGSEPCNGVITGAVAAEGRKSVANTALSFDETAYIDLTYFDVPENCTISFWFKTTDTNGCILSWSELPSTPGSDNITIGVLSSVLAADSDNGPASNGAFGTTVLTNDAWTHGVIIISEGSNCRIIVNGVEETDDDIYSGLSLNTLKIGSNFTGVIDDICIYDRVLSGTEIGLLHFN